MRAILILGVLAVPFVTFALGRLTANRQPGDNHQAMATYLARLLAVDSLTAILSREQQEDAQRLVDDFTDHINQKESR